MKLFLTSNPGGYILDAAENRIATPLSSENNLLAGVKAAIPPGSTAVLFCSDPEAWEWNDARVALMAETYRLSGIELADFVCCDRRNAAEAGILIARAGLVVLAGGHVPTENRFYNELSLGRRLAGFGGVILGISAGSMNSAHIVYAQPELPGEAIDPDYQRYLPGLGLTHINVLPHFDTLRGQLLDGLRLLEDISLPDSHVRPFYALPDGSYLVVEENGATLFGEGYYLADGTLCQIGQQGEQIQL